jgi:osmotically-inducible protein OsmY
VDHGPPESAEYLAGWLENRIAEDSDAHELGITVRVAGEAVFLSGVVTTDERREQVGTYAASLLPDRTVRNEVAVATYAEPVGQESLA